MTFTTGEEKPHAVCMPWPAQGHIHAMLKLAKLLHFQGFHITFVHTEFDYNRILMTSDGSSSLPSLDDFRYETIMDGLPPSDPNATQDLDSLCIAIQNNFSTPFRNLLKRLNEPSCSVPPVTCIVSDCFTSFTLKIAEKFKIPNIFFCPVSACAYMGFIHYKELGEKGLMPHKREDDLRNGSLDTAIDWIPGMKNMRLKDLQGFPPTTDPKDIKFNFVKDESQEAHRASAIIINTFNDLESQVLDAMASILPPIYTIGPLTLLCCQTLNNSMKSIGLNNLWREDSSCLEWLERREPGSVIYLNFGSLAVMTNEQLIEFAWGLANSGHDFLWVIRPDVVNGDTAILPKELLDETKERGLLISWCPQEDVLMHKSIGGFLTHCGWNSMMESISAGVPMLCWPYFGDQPTNCRYACNEWEIGVEIGNNVRRDEVEGMIRDLMVGDKGKEMRKKAVEWKENAIKATAVGGKSFMNFERVIKEVLLKKE